MRISDWSSDVCSSDLHDALGGLRHHAHVVGDQHERHAALALQRDQQFQDLRLDGDVEGGGRLIGYQQARIAGDGRSEEHTSELQSLMRISYAVFCLKKNKIYKSSTP